MDPYILQYLYYDGVKEVDRINTSQLKSPFRENGQSEHNLAPNCGTLCLILYKLVKFHRLY